MSSLIPVLQDPSGAGCSVVPAPGHTGACDSLRAAALLPQGPFPLLPWGIHRVLGYPELAGTHKDHQSSSGINQETPTIPP